MATLAKLLPQAAGCLFIGDHAEYDCAALPEETAPPPTVVEIAIIGAGTAGHRRRLLSCQHGATADRGSRSSTAVSRWPTSAASGENYRNWWPYPAMTEFTDRSIALMEAIARDTGNRIRMARRARARHATCGSRDPIQQLYLGYGADAGAAIRIHDGNGATRYAPPSPPIGRARRPASTPSSIAISSGAFRASPATSPPRNNFLFK